MDLKLEQDLNAIIKMQPLFGKHANLVWAYVSLFQVTPMKAKTAKIRVLLEEMKALLEQEQFSFQKKSYKISAKGILEALNIVVHRHFDTPLANHNYLKSCMISISEREGKDAGRAQEKDLRAREKEIMAGRREGDKSPSVPLFQRGKGRTEETDKANLARVQGLIKTIG